MTDERREGQRFVERILAGIAATRGVALGGQRWLESASGPVIIEFETELGRFRVSFSDEELEDAPATPQYDRLFERRIVEAWPATRDHRSAT